MKKGDKAIFTKGMYKGTEVTISEVVKGGYGVTLPSGGYTYYQDDYLEEVIYQRDLSGNRWKIRISKDVGMIVDAYYQNEEGYDEMYDCKYKGVK